MGVAGSASSTTGRKPCARRLARRRFRRTRAPGPPRQRGLPEPEPILRPEVDEKAFTIRESETGWHVYGIAIERTARMTNWGQYEAAARFQRVLEAMGITMALREAGVEEGDTVYIGDTELEWGWQDNN